MFRVLLPAPLPRGAGTGIGSKLELTTTQLRTILYCCSSAVVMLEYPINLNNLHECDKASSVAAIEMHILLAGMPHESCDIIATGL